MRRAVSIIFFVLGGWALMGEPLMAFLNVAPEIEWVTPVILAICLVMAAVPLGIATASSPGERWRELGLTMLLSIGFAAFGALSFVVMLFDPGGKLIWAEAGPMPDVRITPLVGTANLALMTLVAWWLYRRKPASQPAP